MQLSSADETDLLSPLYEGAFDQPLWSTFLERLRARARADHASIMLRSVEGAASESFVLGSGRAASDAVARRRVEELYRLDPFPFLNMRPERIYAGHELLDMAAPAQLRILEPAGLSYFRVVRIQEPSSTDAWCAIWHQSRDFPASAGALLGALAPHLRIAFRTFAAIQREQIRASISDDVVKRLNFGWLALGADGRIIDLDKQAENFLQGSSLLRRARNGRLLTSRPSADRELAQLLRVANTPKPPGPRLIRLSDDPWFDMLAVPLPAKGAPTRERAVVAIYIQGDERGGTGRCEQLMAMFNLSLNEARLALALSRGHTIAEAAAELGVTLESARTYSKRVYTKTATRGQSDLIRLLLTSVIALA